jgi:Reverse transcriptase (RNA-dependent DNA polymerase)
MKQHKYASLVDLKAGYHNIPWDETNKYGIFITHRGKFKWLRMPFGLTNAPAHFQWAMEDIIHGDNTDGKQKLNC